MEILNCLHLDEFFIRKFPSFTSHKLLLLKNKEELKKL